MNTTFTIVWSSLVQICPWQAAPFREPKHWPLKVWYSNARLCSSELAGKHRLVCRRHISFMAALAYLARPKNSRPVCSLCTQNGSKSASSRTFESMRVFSLLQWIRPDRCSLCCPVQMDLLAVTFSRKHHRTSCSTERDTPRRANGPMQSSLRRPSRGTGQARQTPRDAMTATSSSAERRKRMVDTYEADRKRLP